MPAGPRIRSNSEFGLITDNPLTIGATTFNSARLSLFPVVSAAHAVVTLDPRAINGEPEIVIITAHSAAATVATITRGAYGTAARAHPAGTEWIHAPIDEDFIEIVTSSTRPSNPYEGQQIYETDTKLYKSYSGTAWIGTARTTVPSCRIRGTVAQTIPDAGNVAVNFGASRWDNDNMWSAGTPTRITFTTSGLYLVGATMQITVSNDYVHIMSQVRLLGATVIGSSAYQQNNVVNTDGRVAVSTVWNFAAGEWIDFSIYADNTAGSATRQILVTSALSPEAYAVYLGSVV